MPLPGRSSFFAIGALAIIIASVVSASAVISYGESSIALKHHSSTTTAVSEAATTSTSPPVTISTFTPCQQGNATMPPPPCHFGDVYTSLVFSGGGSVATGYSSISQNTSDFLATRQTGIGLDCGDMSGGGTGTSQHSTYLDTMTCFAVYPTTNPYVETPLDTVSFNLTQVSPSTFDFDLVSVNVPAGVSPPQIVNWSLGGGKFLEDKIGQVVQQNYTGPRTNFSLSLSFTVHSKNISGTMFTQKWSLTNSFAISLYLPAAIPPGRNPRNDHPWKATTVYPQGFVDSSCVQSSGYVYCIAGNDYGSFSNAVYYGKVSSSGVGEWQSTTPYPLNDSALHCVAYGGFVYCLGGDDGAPSNTNASYYAPISSSGVGAWKETTSYPMNCGINFTGTCFVGGCTSISDYVYCMSGTSNTGYTNAVYYANMTSEGLGQWQRSAYDYPVAIAYSMACTSGGGRIYCVGGYGFTNDVYYASFSNGQIGPWSQGPGYPWAVANAACVYSAGSIYCVGGENDTGYSLNQTYYTHVTSSGLGKWIAGSDYPSSVSDQSCFTDKGEIFCVGGLDFTPGLNFLNEVYYSQFPSA